MRIGGRGRRAGRPSDSGCVAAHLQTSSFKPPQFRATASSRGQGPPCPIRPRQGLRTPLADVGRFEHAWVRPQKVPGTERACLASTAPGAPYGTRARSRAVVRRTRPRRQRRRAAPRRGRIVVERARVVSRARTTVFVRGRVFITRRRYKHRQQYERGDAAKKPVCGLGHGLSSPLRTCACLIARD
ncbi:MAG: hypothetical protein RL385_2434 [Pseudomonadota bacterium]